MVVWWLDGEVVANGDSHFGEWWKVEGVNVVLCVSLSCYVQVYGVSSRQVADRRRGRFWKSALERVQTRGTTF